MIRYTADDSSLIFNPARKTATRALDTTLSKFIGKENVSELQFKEAWLDEIAKNPDVIADGWYSPPPMGTAVLFGDRVTFDSLRNEYNWSGNTVIDWENDAFYAYTSPIDKTTGGIGDMSLSIYFGKDRKQIDHIRKCHDAVMDVFESLEKIGTAGDLFRLSQEIFESHRLTSTVISRTDDSPINLGHTFPVLAELAGLDRLTEEQKTAISRARRFTNAIADWTYEPGLQFTIEPQLVSMDDESLPKVTQHYLVKAVENGFIVCNDIDLILGKYGLI